MSGIAVMEGVAVSGMDSVLKYHWVNRIIPELDSFMGEINLTLTPEFGGKRLAWFDTSNVDALTENLMERVRAQKVLHTQGVPLGVLNRRFDMNLDLDGVPLADEPIFPAGVTTGSQILAGANLSGGSGNTNTPPEGGDVVDEGDPEDINDPPVEDVVPDDPGGDPDTQLAAALGRDFYQRHFANGSSDPHEGRRRWSYEEAISLLTDDLEGYVDSDESDKSLDHWTFRGVKLGTDGCREIDGLSGVQYEDQGAAGFVVHFYHGQWQAEKRENLLQRVRRWGYAV